MPNPRRFLRAATKLRLARLLLVLASARSAMWYTVAISVLFLLLGPASSLNVEIVHNGDHTHSLEINVIPSLDLELGRLKAHIETRQDMSQLASELSITIRRMALTRQYPYALAVYSALVLFENRKKQSDLLRMLLSACSLSTHPAIISRNLRIFAISDEDIAQLLPTINLLDQDLADCDDGPLVPPVDQRVLSNYLGRLNSRSTLVISLADSNRVLLSLSEPNGISKRTMMRNSAVLSELILDCLSDIAVIGPRGLMASNIARYFLAVYSDDTVEMSFRLAGY